MNSPLIYETQMYQPKNHSTLEGEWFDVVEVAGMIAKNAAIAGDGKSIGFGESMEILAERLAIEAKDYEMKCAAMISQNLQYQQPLFAR